METNSQSEKSYNDPVNIFYLANQFYDAYKRCDEYRPIGNGKKENKFVPAYVNLAFSCELYLKALLKLRGRDCKKHSLLNIFNYLEKQDPSITDSIINLSNIVTGYGFSNKGFKFQLGTISETFEKWRYIYEWRTYYLIINAHFFEIFAFSLYQNCEKYINNKNINFADFKNIAVQK